MIRFYRAGTQVKCAITVDVPCLEKRTPFLYWECETDIFAGLLTHAMEKQMDDKLEAIRREAYEEGWKDAKAKQAKKKYFRFGWRTRG